MFAAWGHVLLNGAARTPAIYLLCLGARLGGQRDVGQMTPFDLTLLLLLSNSVQNAITGPDTSLVGGMFAATVLVVTNSLVPDPCRRESAVPRVHPGTAQDADA